MTVVTTRPNDEVFGTFDHADMADDNNATFVGAVYGVRVLGFAEPTPPANSRYKKMAIRVRSRKESGSTSSPRLEWSLAKNYTGLGTGTTLVEGDPNITWSSWTVHTLGTTTKAGTANLAMAFRSSLSSTDVEIAEVWLDTTYVEKPVVTVDAPTGTLTDTTAPEITWTSDPADHGGFQTAYELKIFSDAQYLAGGFDPDTSTPSQNTGIQDGAATAHQLVEPLPDDTYRAYVRIAQTVRGAYWWSDWDYIEFTIDADRPETPTPTDPEDPATGGIAATGQPDQARIQLDVVTNAGVVTSDFVEIERSCDNGETWEYVRRRQSDWDYMVELYEDDPPSDSTHMFRVEDGVVRAYDYEAPNGSVCLYRARTAHDYSPGYARSDWSASDSGQWESADWWLKAADGTRLNVGPFSLPGLSRGSRSKVSQVLGRSNVVVTSDLRGPWMGEVVFQVLTTEEQEELDAILEKVEPLLLQAPEGVHWTDRWLSFGDQDRRWMVNKLTVEETLETLPFIVVQSPAGYVAEAPAVAAEDAVDPEEIVLL